jgi:hypothetical protein
MKIIRITSRKAVTLFLQKTIYQIEANKKIQSNQNLLFQLKKVLYQILLIQSLGTLKLNKEIKTNLKKIIIKMPKTHFRSANILILFKKLTKNCLLKNS